MTQDLAQPAVLFSLTLTPLLPSDVTAATVQALRTAILSFLPDDSATAPLARAPILDQVLLAVAQDAAGGGEPLLLNDTSAWNKEGNQFNTTDEVFNFMVAQAGGVVQAAAALSPAAQARRVLRSDGAVEAAGRGGGSAGSAAGGRRGRALFLQLMTLPLPPPPPSASGAAAPVPGMNLQFNVLTPSFTSAQAIEALFISWQGSGGVPKAATLRRSLQRAGLLDGVKAALIAGNRSAAASALTANVTGVQVVTLTYQRSLWTILLDFLIRNIVNVLLGGCLLIALVLLLSWYNFIDAARQARKAAARKKQHQARLAAVISPIRFALARRHWRRAFVKVRAVVRLLLLLREVKARREELEALAAMRKGMHAVAGVKAKAAAAAAARAAEDASPTSPGASLPALAQSQARFGFNSLSPPRGGGGGGGGGGDGAWATLQGAVLPKRANNALARAAAAALTGLTALPRAISVKRATSQTALRLASKAGREVAGAVLGGWGGGEAGEEARRPSVSVDGGGGGRGVGGGGGGGGRGGGARGGGGVSPTPSQGGGSVGRSSPAHSLSPSQAAAYTTSPGVSPGLRAPSLGRRSGDLPTAFRAPSKGAGGGRL